MSIPWLNRNRLMSIGKWSGYIVFGLVVFLIAVVMTFPTHRLRSYIETMLSKGETVVRIADLSMRGLGSVRLEGVTVDLPPARTTMPDGRVEADSRRVELDRIDLSVGLIRLLFGGLSVRATIFDGDGVLGPIRVLRSGDLLEVEISEIRDFPLPTELPLFGVRMSGVLKEGRASLTYDVKEGFPTSSGRLELKGEDIRAIEPAIRSQAHGTASLSTANLGTLALEINLGRRSTLAAFKADRRSPAGDSTVLHFEKAEIDGSDVKALIEGQSTIRLTPGRPLTESQLAIDAAFSLSDSFFDRTVKVGGENRTPNRFLKTLLSMDPRWRAAQSGIYWGVMCSGALNRPACLPKRPTIRGGDFKAPPLEVAAPEPVVEKSKPVPARIEPAAQPAAPVVPAPVVAAPLPPQPTPPPPSSPFPPPRREEPPPSQIDAPAGMGPGTEVPQMLTPAGMNRLEGGLQPTVIGRARLRGLRTIEEEAPEPVEGQGEEGEENVE
jgi:type II secretion system protein N